MGKGKTMARVLEERELAIIIPILNCLEYTKQTIETIKTKHKHALFLIDNGSDNQTVNYLARLHDETGANVFLNSFNIGVAATWNQGIRLAKEFYNSRYYAILNNDILLHEEAIDVMLKTIQRPDIALVSGTDVCGRVAIPQEVLQLQPTKDGILREAPEFSCFMVKDETIHKVGFFDDTFYPAYFEDNDYHRRINLAGLKAVSDSRSLYYHYGSRTLKQDDKIRERVNIGYALNQDYYIQKWGGIPGKERYKTPFNEK